MHAVRLYTPRMEKRIVGYLRKSDRVATLQHLECVWLMKKNVASPCLLERAVPSVLRLLFVYDSCAGFFCLFVMVMRMMNAVDAPCRR